MPKICQSTECTYNVFSHNYCKQHQNSRTDDKWLKSSKGKITPKVKESGLKPPKSKRIKPISDKQLVMLAEYRLVRDKYFKDNPICEFKGCYSTELTLHHRAGKIGDLLTDSRYFCSLCFEHHRWVHDNDFEARELGLLVSRLDK